ncbi:MAG TPA: hypothetical protein VIL49_12105 [Capillimicrobium sp.]
MIKISPRLAAALAPAVLAAALVAVPAAAAKTVAYEASGSVSRTGADGSTVRYAGSVSAKGIGTGRVTQTLRLSGLKARGTFRVSYPGGSIRGRVRAKASLGVGQATFKGRLRITGGTGKFAGASGSGRYSGTSSLDLARATFTQRGTITY